MEWSRGPVIGRGSTATVSLATSVASGHLFALKSAELSRSLFLQREQRILSNLSSPYIVKYIGSAVSHDGDTPMYNLCMEYAAGGTLSDVIRRRGGRLGEGEIGAAARRILRGLDYLHGNGLAHCDIKSQNVLVDEVEGAIIGDFGCAKFVGGEVVFSGTPAFMAPEVARGEEQGFAADVWAVGCTVIEMATGRGPWAELGDNPVSALYRIGFSDDLPEVPSWFSEEATDFVAKCLMKDPRERWSAKELLDHPFLDELEWDRSIESKEAGTSSPSCVLDQGFWDSVDSDSGLDSPQTLTIHELCCSSRIPPGDRIESLINNSGLSASNFSDWSWEEEGWITVRSNQSEGTFVGIDGMFLDTESSAAEQDAAVFWDSAISDLEEEEVGLSGSSDEESPAAGLELDSIENAIVITNISRRDGFVVVNQADENRSNENSGFVKSVCSAHSFSQYSTNQANSKQGSRPNTQTLAYCSVLVKTITIYVDTLNRRAIIHWLTIFNGTQIF